MGFTLSLTCLSNWCVQAAKSVSSMPDGKIRVIYYWILWGGGLTPPHSRSVNVWWQNSCNSLLDIVGEGGLHLLTRGQLTYPCTLWVETGPLNCNLVPLSSQFCKKTTFRIRLCMAYLHTKFCFVFGKHSAFYYIVLQNLLIDFKNMDVLFKQFSFDKLHIIY